MSATYRYIRIYIYIYPITLNGYIYSPGKKIEKINKKIEKINKKIKKLKIFGTISGALARSLIYVYIYPITLNGYIYSPGKKNRKNQKKIEKKKKIKKIKNARNNFWGPCQVLNVCISSFTSQHVYIGAGTSHRSARS